MNEFVFAAICFLFWILISISMELFDKKLFVLILMSHDPILIRFVLILKALLE
jgi:hypothetical protein